MTQYHFNSTLKKKTCKNPDCNKYPKIGLNGYCSKACMPEEMASLPKYNKKQTFLRKESIKAGLSRKLHAVDDTQFDDEKRKKVELQLWFIERGKQMTGRCQHCGGKSCKGDIKYEKFSIAHILPKAYFPSVSTHPDNWLELCFWKNSCHTNLDNNQLDLIDLNCFDDVIKKIVKIYPSIAKEERRRIPAILMQYLDVET